MSTSHAQSWLPVALLLALALPPALQAADEAAPPRADCDPEQESSWPACGTGTLCWCAGDVEYRRDKVILNDLVLYQGGSPLLVRAKRAETPSTDTADSTWNLSGGVRSRLAQGQLAADNATVHFESSNLTAAMFDGKPATFEETPTPVAAGSPAGAPPAGPAAALGSVKGSAHTIEYDNVAGGEVRLRGDVQLFDGCKDIHGDGFVYNLTQKSLKSLEPVAGSSRERVRGTFQQKCKPAPPPAPGTAPPAATSSAPATAVPAEPTVPAPAPRSP